MKRFRRFVCINHIKYAPLQVIGVMGKANCDSNRSLLIGHLSIVAFTRYRHHTCVRAHTVGRRLSRTQNSVHSSPVCLFRGTKEGFDPSQSRLLAARRANCDIGFSSTACRRISTSFDYLSIRSKRTDYNHRCHIAFHHPFPSFYSRPLRTFAASPSHVFSFRLLDLRCALIAWKSGCCC